MENEDQKTILLQNTDILVKFMENLRYIDQLGRGLPMVYQEATGNGKKVKFEEIGEEFKVSLEILSVGLS